MSIGHLLEDFGAYVRGQPVAMTDELLEEQKLEAFEKGYQAGWDDHVKVQSEEAKNITADFSQNLLDLSFTYHEAHTAMRNSLEPLLRQMVEAVLPQLAHQTLGARLIDMLTELASMEGTQPVELVTSPSNTAALEALVAAETAMPLTVMEEPSLGEGQVYIRFGQVEREIDLTEVLQGINQAVSGFFEENRKEIA